MEIIITFIIPVCVLIFSFIYQYKDVPMTCQAMLVDKREERIRNGRYGATIRYLTFQCEDGKWVELKSDRNDFERFQLDDCGTLNYSGQMLLKFEKNN